MREHHDFGDIIGNIANVASNLAPLAPLLFLKKGGSTKMAAGAVAKIRKGMLSKDGKIIKPN